MGIIQDRLNKIEDTIRNMFYFDKSLEVEYDYLKDDILLKVSKDSFPIFDILRIERTFKEIKREYMYMGTDPVNHNAALRIYFKK